MDKKEEKKIAEEVVWIVIAVLVILMVPVLWSYVSAHFGASLLIVEADALVVSAQAYGILVGLSIPVSILLLIGIVSAVEGTNHVRRKEALLYEAKVEPAYDASAKGDPALSKKWQSVLLHADSPSQSDWRQAIIEADIILGDILTRMQYPGAGIGEQLKAAVPGDFKTLDQAWEAHRVRNQIAHEGSDFALSQHEAKRIVGLYRQVFEEFFYI